MNLGTLFIIVAVAILLAVVVAGCTQVHLTGDGCVSVREGSVTAAVGGSAGVAHDCTQRDEPPGS